MPPSPALRCSPGREVRAESHKRGRSLEGGLLFREKDDDLALFKEMQTRERDNFLLQSDDDLEDVFSTKLTHFSDFKLGISIPGRGESSDLLNADGEKNDYEWLLTPPDTPLFPSLDDDTPPANVVPRGRPRSQPISISRSSTMEKSYRSSRGSASPSRSSPSPRSGNSAAQSRGRPSSARHASPTPSLQNATPPQRPSTPPSKTSVSAPRSSTPTSRRMSSGFSSTSGSGVRGASPVKTSRGNSASPKIRAWQANIPGFSTEVPPNLRTSLADRPASYVRGSSPASRNSRQSVSPTASRSVASSYGHERDHFSSHSRGSVASSGDDDVDSLQSIQVGSLDRSTLRKVGSSPNRRSLVSSRTKAVSSVSAPKRSLDPALRQTDHRKAPQNMFRPLLSSVPSSTFYIGKAGSMHRPMVSRNSSVTTSSNASSDHGTGTVLAAEGSDQNRDDKTCESGGGIYATVDQEIFEFDKGDTATEDMGSEIYAAHQSLNIPVSDFEVGTVVESGHANAEDSCQDSVIEKVTAASEVDDFRDLVLCSICGCPYDASESVENEENLCSKCRRKEDIFLEADMVVAGDFTLTPIDTPDKHQHLNQVLPVVECESQGVIDVDEPRVLLGEENNRLRESFSKEQSQVHLLGKSSPKHLIAGDNEIFSNERENFAPRVGSSPSHADATNQELQQYTDHKKIDVTEGAGISLLLKRSSSSKGHVIQGRTYTVSAIPRDDLSYARDSSTSMRSSYGRESISGSSSVDFSSSRQTDVRIHRQLSGLKSESEDYKYDIKTQSIGSSFSGFSNHASQGFGLAASMHDFSEDHVGSVDTDAEESILASLEKKHALETTDAVRTSTMSTSNGVDTFESNESSKALNASTTDLSSHAIRMGLEDNTVVSSNVTDTISLENGAVLQGNSRVITEMDASAVAAPGSSAGEGAGLLSSGASALDCSDVPADHSLVSSSEMETMNGQSRSLSESEHKSESKSPETLETEMNASAQEPKTSDHGHGIQEESTVTMEARAGSRGRSLTLEEATDTILFCSSIVHDLAYKAATIAMEKEPAVPLEGSHPAVTILGKSTTETRDPRRGRIVSKRSLKSQKARQRQVETEKNLPSSKTENDENIDESLMRNVGIPNKLDTVKPPKLESKCNCTIM
ncbi:uncharacterized protein LOC115738917 [Rhodamnia argentea]|uniref:Uncharacterized protein LOC115738917 n=1 Tax=Rhodamnia argentea TaxID=178133 RepID=A0A8B8NYG0_9MYRT|nr:uncharacterized protein LOC115738917 [Rhodamnia argentea]